MNNIRKRKVYKEAFKNFFVILLLALGISIISFLVIKQALTNKDKNESIEQGEKLDGKLEPTQLAIKINSVISLEDSLKKGKFGIENKSNNVYDFIVKIYLKDILADTEIDLGTLDLLENSISTYADSGVDWKTNNSVRYYEINANFGRNWSNGDKNFIYQITTVYSQADEYVDQTLSYTYDNTYVNFTRFLYSSVSDIVDIPNVDESKTYISFAIEGEEIVENGLIDGVVNQLNVVVNGEQAVYAEENLMGYESVFEGHLHYATNKLDSSDNYLNIIVTFGDNTYTYIAKIAN